MEFIRERGLWLPDQRLCSIAPGIMPVIGGSSGAGSPPLTNLYLWWDVTQETGYADNDEMSGLTAITDRSGNGHHGQTGSGNQAPLYRSTGVTINGLPVADFNPADGANKFQNSTSTAGFTAASIFVVARCGHDPATSSSTSGWWIVSDGYDFGNAMPYTDSHIYENAFTTTQRDLGNPTGSQTTAFYYGVLSTTNFWEARLNGSVLLTTGTNTFKGNGGGAPTLGNSGVFFGHSLASGYDASFDGQMGELLVYNAVLSGADLTQIESYLAAKWGI